MAVQLSLRTGQMVHDSAAVAACGEPLCAHGGGCDLKLSCGLPGALCLLPESAPYRCLQEVLGDTGGRVSLRPHPSLVPAVLKPEMPSDEEGNS